MIVAAIVGRRIRRRIANEAASRYEPKIRAGMDAWEAARASHVTPAVSVAARRTEGGLQVFGTADLPDGMILRYGVNRPGLLGWFRDRQAGEVRVTAGAFRIELPRIPARTPVAQVRISVLADESQPPATRALLGDHGERMTSDVGGPTHREYFIFEEVAVESGS